MSSINSNKNERRDKEKEDLIKRLGEIEKEEEEDQNEVEQAYLIQPDFFIKTFNNNENDENADINNKLKRKNSKLTRVISQTSLKTKKTKLELYSMTKLS
jgi:hypothetical protein